MKKAIIHRHPKDPLYIEITECEENEVAKTKSDLEGFGSKILAIVNADEVPEIEKRIAKLGGKNVGLI